VQACESTMWITANSVNSSRPHSFCWNWQSNNWRRNHYFK